MSAPLNELKNSKSNKKILLRTKPTLQKNEKDFWLITPKRAEERAKYDAICSKSRKRENRKKKAREKAIKEFKARDKRNSKKKIIWWRKSE